MAGELFLSLGDNLANQPIDGMDRKEILALVKARHRSAVNKVSRLKNQGGVKIAGTTHDVRRDLKKVENYNTPQLKSYLSKLESFNDRSTRFIGDAHGRVLDPAKWAIYKERERAVKRKEAKEYARIKDVRLPEPGTARKSKKTETIDQRNQRILPTRRAGKNRTTNSPFNSPVRKPNQIKSAKSLDVMAEAMAKRLAGDYKSGEIKEQRRIFNDMLDVIGNDKLKKSVGKLTDREFDVMWNHTSMPDDVVDIYVLMRHDEDDTDEQHNQKIMSIDQEKIAHSGERIGAWIGWAKSLKLNG